PEVRAETRRAVVVEVDGATVASGEVVLKPVRHLTIYLLPHSHTDIGYTQIQTAIQQKQVQNLLDGIAAARRTADYPEGARFVWNVEVLWAADLYLHRLDASQRAEFFDAVKRGQVALNGMYLNELTGLCRPEELIRLFRFATQIERQTGVRIDAAMISDVPGYTWGTVTALAQAGIKYFSAAPNYFDRIGSIMRDWENKPFWWIGPDGHSRVLTWIPFWGYALSHRYGRLSPRLIDDFFAHLDQHDYPYDLAYFRWSGHGDNAVPDPAICDYVRDWNTQYVWPHFIIASTSRAFHEFDQRYGRQLPVVRGDWTPYWEDGAGSSARETALNRANADRLSQAESVFAMFDPQSYPAPAFDAAWKDVLLYSEHTWGAWCSISQPDNPLTLDQWAIKRGYVENADRQSRKLLADALSRGSSQTIAAHSQAVDIWNTLSWPRTDLVSLNPELSGAGDRVVDDHGQPVPSQRLTSGQLAFLARDVPPFAARRYTVAAGTPWVETRATADPAFSQTRPTPFGGAVDSGTVRAAVDAKTGGIVELTARGLRGNFVDTREGEGLNDYLYLLGDQLQDLQHNGPVNIRLGEPGPLVASLIIQSAAPGCNQLGREVRVVAGRDYVELIDTVDKQRLEATNYYANDGKESVNFAFPFAVPGGQIRLDTPLAVMRPELDQIPSACKNWFVVGRWADVSNRQQGVTWVTLDAPLVEIGDLTARLLNSQTNPEVWRQHVGPTQKIYSWAMNNHWGTNYRAYQEGRVVFRFILRPHRHSDPAEATRFATAFSFPLLPVCARGPQPARIPFLRVSPPDVTVITLKPSDDGRALIVRLFGASGHNRSARLDWGEHRPRALFLSDTSERPCRQIGNQVTVPGYGVVTLRAEF
ncbi:MAG: hypothetical protein KGS61_06865, partial [Verrucomicrobia bacterium]|nr:hypothetical protein [Verrucomicrobiota bacterium]